MCRAAPAEIAESAIEAAKAGAAVVHCHVRDPETGAPARDPALYRAALSGLEPARVPTTGDLHGWLRRNQRHEDLRQRRALRAWIFAHDAAISGVVVMVGAFILVWLKY